MSDATGPDREWAAWAEGVMARLDAQAQVDDDLLAALGNSPHLREETLLRMAEALRAAALGLGPAGCAAAAGVPERLLHTWRDRQPAFAGALSAAHALARSYALGADHGRPPPLTPVTLRVLLKQIRAGTRIPPAAAAVGVSVRTLNRLRREHPRVDALIVAARRARPKRADRRGTSAFTHGYRLIRTDATPADGNHADDASSKG
ncbi:hypothetical protein Stsp02_26840 [Streptomyces sp. NBRC 14336]|uniref:hypothetical protein n=1 Tax=Streptomyces sp. NBRC 14336 TaxID=3030992 RepID=UPI0024A0CC30|nr:hypothetical protein [Streptomyces sp. NBRC 14336]WBO76405.1 hypothetical protein SBE_007178 [Streptomyces sp. SBE_14.2]GLW47022.1 hypothetical protein Stsp02_26840 [Streptomyces sp. NBRC 14336]